MPIEVSTQLLKRRRTKIVATVGPASGNQAVIEQLIEAGVNVFRLNMSHGDHETHRNSFNLIRTAATKFALPVAILADLCGPKIRCGMFRDGKIELLPGQRVIVTTRDVIGEEGLIPSQYEELADDVKAGNAILLDDGILELRVESVQGSEIACVVVHGGTLKNRKGINLPGVNVSAPSLTEKDRRDALFALELGVDFLALSFVRRSSDVVELKALIAESGRAAAVISKIEKPEALADIDAILDVSDGIMVARGDLGVELAPESVPVIQSQLVDLARSKGKPVIVATQMLESMIENARPTRAEVADVSHAVMSGADAVMLSAETASGAHPVRAVAMMNRIAFDSEGYLWKQGAFSSIVDHPLSPPPIPLVDAVARATSQLSRDLAVRAIFVVSFGGATARFVSSARPAAPVLAVSTRASTCRLMNLLWGVVPLQVEESEVEDPNALARRLSQELGLATSGEYLLRVSGFHHDPAKNVPAISVLFV